MNVISWTPSVRTALATTLCGLALGVGTVFVPFEVDVRRREALVGNTDGPGARIDPGSELLLVIIGSSACGWSTAEELPSLFAASRRALHARATGNGAAFATLGVAQDEAPHDGMEYLRRFGSLDEIAVGRGWRNTAIRKYVYSDFPGVAATPQILVLSRTITGGGGDWGVANERVLLREVGLSAITKWVESGARLPNWPPTSQ